MILNDKSLIKDLASRPYLEIQKKYHISSATVFRARNQLLLSKKHDFWTKNEIKLLKDNYSTHKNISKLLKQKTIKSIYKKAHQLFLRKPFKKRKYKLDEEFFNYWNNFSSYFFGWMYSDGNVTNDLRTISLHLNKKDLKIIKLFQKALKTTQPFFITGKYVKFRVHSRLLANRLISLGCFPRKTSKIRFPPNIPKKYIPAFIRGYFDGDGSIHFNKPNTIKIRLVGNLGFMGDLKIKLQEVSINSSKITKYSGCHHLELYGDNARAFCGLIYKDAGNLYLIRKHDRYITHLKKRDQNVKSSSIFDCK